MSIESAILALADARQSNGNPVKGKLQHLVLNITNDGWQAIAQFWFTEKWVDASGPDPVACIMKVLTTSPAAKPASSLDDLLV